MWTFGVKLPLFPRSLLKHMVQIQIGGSYWLFFLGMDFFAKKILDMIVEKDFLVWNSATKQEFRCSWYVTLFFTSLCRSKAVICRSPSNSTFYARKVCCPLVKIVNLPFVDWFGWDIWQNTWFVVLREIKLKTESENPAQMSCSVLLWETSIPLEPSGASFLHYEPVTFMIPWLILHLGIIMELLLI